MEEIFEKISDSELEVMKVLWEAEGPLPITDIRQTLQRTQGWEATTVKTLVGRLCSKGAVAQEKRNVFYYKAAVPQTDYNSWAANRLIHKLYQGRASSFVAALVNARELSDADIAELKELFDQY